MTNNFKKLALTLTMAVAFTSARALADEHVHEAQQKPASQQRVKKAAKKELYTCPMHKDYVSDKPGDCPKCGMHLVKKNTASGGTAQGK